MKHSTIKALENLKRQKDEIIEIEDLSEYYKDIFGEDVEPQAPEESRYNKNEYGRKAY